MMAVPAAVAGTKRPFVEISGSEISNTSSGPGIARENVVAAQKGLVSAVSDEVAAARKVKPSPGRMQSTIMCSDEPILPAAALERQRRLQGKRMKDAALLDAPTFYPTEEEFEDPCAYIERIRPAAEPYGVCKIVPPEGWAPPSTEPQRMRSAVKYKTRLQALHTLQEGVPFPDGQFYTYAEYKEMAMEFKRTKFPHLIPQATNSPKREVGAGASGRVVRVSDAAIMASKVEQTYWRIVEDGEPHMFVEYGNDQEARDVGSGFPPTHPDFCRDGPFPQLPARDFADPDYYAKCGWNLNNIPFVPHSVLRHLNEEINGVNVPWLYLGMLFSTFAWHNEDHFMYSINYMHDGEGKTWYGIPGFAASHFEKALQWILPHKAEDGDLVFHLTTLISPAQLLALGVPVCRLFQEPGDFVVTFPQAYHAGFSHGFNMAEACNFALVDWIPYGKSAVERYRVASAMRSMCFSHELLMCNLAKNHAIHPLNHCAIIAKELVTITNNEKAEREALAREGVTTAIALPNPSDPRYECIHCRQICYLSAVVCRCTGQKKQVACLRHHRHLCSCPSSSKVLVYWYKIEELEKLADAVTARSGDKTKLENT